jgi:hypothetical protein
MSEPKPTYNQPDIRMWKGQRWRFMHGRPYLPAPPESDAQPVTDRNGFAAASDAQPAPSLSSMAHPANQPVKVEEWDAVAVVCKVAREKGIR